MNLTKAKELFQPGEQRRRLIMTLVGIVVCAMSGGIMKRAGFGGDPFQMFTNGLDNVLPLDFGTIHVIISGILLTVIFKLDKHFIGVAASVEGNETILKFTNESGEIVETISPWLEGVDYGEEIKIKHK